MSPYNIKTVAGDILNQTFTFTNADNTPIDLTIYDDIVMQVRKKPGEAIESSGSLGDSDFSIGGVGNNELTINLQMPLVSGTYQYDIEFIGQGIRETKIGGYIYVRPQITIVE